MEGVAADHRALLDAVVESLNAPDDGAPLVGGVPAEGPIRALTVPDAWESGGFSKLWRMKREGFAFGSAGVLSAQGDKTLGCVRYHRPSEPDKPARSVFLLLALGAEGPRVQGVFAEVPLALGWLRGWIVPGQRVDALPSDDAARELAAAIVEAPRGGLGAVLQARLGLSDDNLTRLLGELPDGPLRAVGVHSLPVVGRSLIGLGKDPGPGAERDRAAEVWLVTELRPDAERPRLVAVTGWPSLPAMLTGARAVASDGAPAESDLFVDRLLAVVRASDNRPSEDQRERFRQELILRLQSAFARQMPNEQTVADAVKAVLKPDAQAARAKNIGELIKLVLERVADRSET